jgi:hypothetical protein
MELGSQLHVLAALPTGKEPPVPIREEAGVCCQWVNYEPEYFIINHCKGKEFYYGCCMLCRAKYEK